MTASTCLHQRFLPLLLALASLACNTLRAGDADQAIAACSASTGNPGVTIERCSDAIENAELTGPQRSVALTRRGLARFAQQELAKAATDLDEATRADPGSWAAWNGRGIVAMQAGDAARAIESFDAALKARPDFASALANRGNAWLARGDAQRALADLDRAVGLRPARIELALTLRARARLALGDADAALADFDAALAANAGYSNAIDGRAYAQLVLGHYEQAAADFTREWRQRPDVETAAIRVIALRRAGHDARRELEEAARGAGTAQGAAPALALLAGQMKPGQVLQATGDRDPNVQRQRRCTAEFQVGEWHLLGKDVAQARQHLAAAAAACTPAQPEYAAARAELARLPAP